MNSKYRLLKVTWLDACSLPAGWKSVKKAKKSKPAEIVSVGYLVKERKRSITLVSSLTDDGDCDGDVVIPRDWIVRTKKL